MDNPISFYDNFTLLAQLYRIDISTFRKMIKPIRHQLKAGETRVYLTPKEIDRIVTYLGNPGKICGYNYYSIRTFKALAKRYKKDCKTMSAWTQRLPIKFDDARRKILTPREVEMIIDHLGVP